MISRSDLMIDVPERRAVAQAFEVRAAGNNIAKITGYASIFDRGYDVYGGPTSPDGWTEIVNRSAFKRTLAENPHVHLLINHAQDGGLPLASTKSGTLRLSTDSTGLIQEAEVDRRNSRANDLVLTLERGDADEMSFAFRVKANTWSDGDTVRSLDEVSLHKGDVSVVGFGANPHTSVSVRNALRTLAREEFSDDELAELRSMSDQVDAAMAALEQARKDAPLTPGSHHADPGFLDADGKPAEGGNGVPRYQIDDAAHVRDALSRFSANKGKYTPAQQKHIMDAIESQAKKFGVTVDD
jgi:HK97 family phage prohead protease